MTTPETDPATDMDLNHLPLHRRPVHREDVDNLIPKTQRVTPGHVLLAAGYPKVRRWQAIIYSLCGRREPPEDDSSSREAGNTGDRIGLCAQGRVTAEKKPPAAPNLANRSR